MRRDDRLLVFAFNGAIAGIFVFFCYLIYPFFFKNVGYLVQKYFKINPLIAFLVVVLPLAWILFIFLRENQQASDYRLQTGRNLRKDKAKYHKDYKYLKEFYLSADPKKLDLEEFPAKSWKSCKGVMMGEVSGHTICKPSAAPGNLLLLGRPGDGKSAMVIKPTIRNFGGSIVAIDVKPELAAYADENGRKMKVFDPSDASGYGYDPFYGVADLDPVNKRVFIENQSFIIVPDQKGDNGQFFVEGARDFFNGICLYLLDKYPGISFGEVCQVIPTQSWEDWVNIVVNDQHEASIQYLKAYQGTNEKNTSQQFQLLVKSVRKLTAGALATLLSSEGENIHPEDLDEGYDLYLRISQDMLQIYAPVLSLITANLMTYFLRRPDESTGIKLRPILFCLDEFGQLQFSRDMMDSSISVLRSKKVSMLFATQSIEQIKDRYSESFSRNLIDNCAYIMIMSAQDPQTAKYFSDILGTKKVLKVGYNDSEQTNYNGSSGQSVQEVDEPIIRPEKLNDLGDKLLIIIKGKYVFARKIKSWL